MPSYHRNEALTYEDSPYVQKNPFIGRSPEVTEPIRYEEVKDRMPRPVFDGHEAYLRCYDKAWQLAFSHTLKPVPESGFVSSFIDTAFNNCLFMWDSTFIMMFTKYADRVFPFYKTMDNFYALQHRDGYICREIVEADGTEHFSRYDPSATGPDIMAWCELVGYENRQNQERIAEVYPVLRAYHEWLRRHHTWRDGTYFASGWGCGMDNIPRQPGKERPEFSTGHMVWNDICFQAIFSAKNLIRMNRILGEPDDVADLEEEVASLTNIVNEQLWDDEEGFYFDLWPDGRLNRVKHIGAYWSILADCVPEDRLGRLIAHLENPKEFFRPNCVPALSADSPAYAPEGDYWCGGVWAPTTYMVLKALESKGYTGLARRIAERHLENVVSVYRDTGTLWENYAPEHASRGNSSSPDFVGWTGLAPISVFIEYVLGIRADTDNHCLVWDCTRTERHGVERYPFSLDTTVDLLCEKREKPSDEPHVTVRANHPVTVMVRYEGGEKRVEASVLTDPTA